MKNTLIVLLTIVLLASCSAGKQVSVSVSNRLGIDRENEMVEISKNAVFSALRLKPDEKIFVLDQASNGVVYQIATNFGNQSDSLLIFPATVKAGGTSVYTIKKGKPDVFQPKVAGRLVPERKDDFNWENDRVAYRMYGPALQATGEISSGIDIWAKRTDKLVADKWYADELSGKSTYHNDNGEGLDFYKVGPTLGAGAAAPYVDNQLWFSRNFENYTILDKGPLRITFRLDYGVFNAGPSGQLTSSRIISLDAGSQLNKIRQIYEFKSEKMPVAAGIVMRNSPDEEIFIDKNRNFAAHAEPADSLNGILYQAITAPTAFTDIEKKHNHLLGLQTVRPSEPFIYYSGGGWSKYGFKTFEDWVKYVSEFSEKLHSPLTIVIR
jgi:hypothetical protein